MDSTQESAAEHEKSGPSLRRLNPEGGEEDVFHLVNGVTTIGRMKTNQIVIGDVLASREHALVRFDGKSVVIEDVGGKNPIRVNGDTVHSHVLLNGDRITIGQTEFSFEFPGMTPVPALNVVRDGRAHFEEGVGGISVDAATVPFERPDLADPAVSEKIYGRLSLLYRISEEILGVQDEEELFDLVLRAATSEVSAERGFLGLSPEDGDAEPRSLSAVRFWDPVKGEKAQTLQMSESIFNHIIRQRRAVLVRDVPDREDFGVSVIDLQIRSFICAPMVEGDHLIGLIYVDTRSQREQFDRTDLEFVSAVARLAALALQKMRSQSFLIAENMRLRTHSSTGSGDLIGNHEKMNEVFRIIEKVAPRDTSVLILGENGTGKELIAQAIHKGSSRSGGAFIPVNCGAIPPNLVESELFGYEKGAFTGAAATTPGKFELASGGTLFLDEIGDMPLDMQVKILRALQERTFFRVGGKKEIEVDIRVLSATNQDLQDLIASGKFREDLYFRLAVVTIPAPPLRERGKDVITISEAFVGQTAGESVTITDAAQECLLKYHWPGNIRELRNVLEQAIIMGDGSRITPQDFPARVAKTALGRLSFTLKPLAEVEKRYIVRVLEETAGNKAKAAAILGIARETLYQKLKQYNDGDGSKG